MTSPKVSVIIPVYNTEKHLQQCCDSLFGQTLKEMEYIYVNDGSADDSVNIIFRCLENYPERKNQTKIIDRKENKGISFSRQEGLNAATGEYVIHCDSDDWVEKEMYQTLYEVAIEKDADIVCCGYVINYPNGQTSCSIYDNPNFFNPIVFNISPLTGGVWNKLVRRSIIVDQEICFPSDTNWGEDFCVTIECLLSANHIECINDCLYHYRQNNLSTTHNLSVSKCMELVNVGAHVEQFLEKTNKRLEYEFQLNYLKFQLKAPLLMFPECRSISLWKETYKETKRDVFRYNCSGYLKITAWLIDHHLTSWAKMILHLRDFLSYIRNK